MTKVGGFGWKKARGRGYAWVSWKFLRNSCLDSPVARERGTQRVVAIDVNEDFADADTCEGPEPIAKLNPVEEMLDHIEGVFVDKFGKPQRGEVLVP